MGTRKRQITPKKIDKVCSAYAGSGWYDNTDSKGHPIRCGACDGMGKDRP